MRGEAGLPSETPQLGGSGTHMAGQSRHLLTVNELPTRPPETRDLVPPFIIRIYDQLDRFTNGREIDEMLADILFIYALMGVLQAAFLTIHLVNT